MVRRTALQIIEFRASCLVQSSKVLLVAAAVTPEQALALQAFTTA